MKDDIVIGPEEGHGKRPDGGTYGAGGGDDTDDSTVEELRHMPVGTNDPNIVGDVGPMDIPPGSDPPRPGDLQLRSRTDEADAEH